MSQKYGTVCWWRNKIQVNYFAIYISFLKLLITNYLIVHGIFSRMVLKFIDSKGFRDFSSLIKILIVFCHSNVNENIFFSVTSGVMPRILFEVSTIVLTSTITYMVSYYVIDSKEYDGVINLISSVRI